MQTIRFVPFLLLLGGLCPVAAQSVQDVLTLKNGWQLRGQATPLRDSVQIITYGGNRFLFAQTEVLRQTQERFVSPAIHYRERGFANFTELGPLAAGNRASNGTTTSAFSLQTVNGYKFSQWVFAGVGVGIDLYAVQTFVPVFVSLRGDFARRGPAIPFYFLDGGYGINATTNDVPGMTLGGGAVGGIGIGTKILFSGNTGFMFSLGYHVQQTSMKSTLLGQQNETISRLALRAGFAF